MDIAAGRKAVKALVATAVSPLEWEISLLRAHDGHIARLNAVRANGILPSVRQLPGAERTAHVNLLAETLEVSTADVQEMLQNLESNLYKSLGEVFSDLGKAPLNPLVDFTYKWLEDNGGKFFHTPDGRALLFWDGNIYPVEADDSFAALIYKLTRLNFKEKPGNFLPHVMKIKALNEGKRIEQVTWMHTDQARDTVYLNLSDEQNKIIKLAPGVDPVAIDNGTNDDRILLNRSFVIKEFNYQPKADEAEAVRAYKRLIMDNTATEAPMRYFIGCWALSCFLLDFQSDRGLLQLIGTSGVGKSKTPERISYLFMGQNQVGQASGAGNVRVAAASPVIFLDNIENKDLTRERVNFLLLLANSALKLKARGDSETEVVQQKLNSLGMITSIEAIPGKIPELLNRTFIVELDRAHRSTSYLHDEVVREIQHKRPEILSGLLKMISRRVLPRLSARAEWSRDLSRHHAGHNKERNNAQLTMMAVILEAILEHAPYREGQPVSVQASELVRKWVEHQETHAKESAHGSNSLLYALNGLAKEIQSRMRGAESGGGNSLIRASHRFFRDETGEFIDVQQYHDRDYAHEFFLTGILENGPKDLPYLDRKEGEEDIFEPGGRHRRFEIIATGQELYQLISRYLKAVNDRNPFDNASSLGARIKNDCEVLAAGGWEIVGSDKHGLHHHKTAGERYWRFRKRIEVD